MDTLNKGHIITNVAGVNKIEISQRGSYVETEIHFIDVAKPISFDVEGLEDFVEAVTWALDRARAIQ